jgi:prophage maintenance system killer protein
VTPASASNRARVPPLMGDARTMAAASQAVRDPARARAERQAAFLAGHVMAGPPRAGLAAFRPSPAPPAQPDALLGDAGRPLDAATRGFFEPRFGVDFSHVRVHTDARATETTASLGALAFAHGPRVAFAPGQYHPATVTGRQLLSHELAHVVLERGRPPVPRLQEAPAAVGNPFAGLDRSNLQHFRELVASLDRAGAVPAAGRAIITVGGRSASLTGEQIDHLRSVARSQLRRGLRLARGRAEGALESYEDQQRINHHHWFVSRIVIAVGGVEDPGGALHALVPAAMAMAQHGLDAIEGGRLADAQAALERAEPKSRRAERLSYAYRSGIIEAGETQVRALEFTRDASFVTLGVLAVVATGGAAAAAAAGAPAATSTVAFGVTIGATPVATATALSIAAPLAATLGEAGTRYALGERVDWGRVAVDVAFSLLLARFGGRLGDRVFRLLGGNAAVQGMGRVVFTRALSSVLMHEGTVVLRAIVDAVYSSMRGRPVTWEQFIEEVARRVSDPRGIIIAAVMGGAVGLVERRSIQAAQRAAEERAAAAPPPPAAAEAEPSTTRPIPPAPAATPPAAQQAPAATTPPQATTRPTQPPVAVPRTTRPPQPPAATQARPPQATTTTPRPTPAPAPPQPTPQPPRPRPSRQEQEWMNLVEAAVERPVTPQTRSAVTDALAALRPALERLRAARRDPNLSPEQRRVLAAAEEEIDALRFGPSTTAQRVPGGGVKAAWQRAADQVRRWADAGEALTLERIMQLNATLRAAEPVTGEPGIRQSTWLGAGKGAERSYPPPSTVQPAMERFIAWYNATRGTVTPVELAAQSYQRLVSIHPFVDANGRTTRLVMDWILRANGLPESPLPGGTHRVAVFGMREMAAPGSGVSPDAIVINLMRGIWQTVARLPASIRGPIPRLDPPL